MQPLVKGMVILHSIGHLLYGGNSLSQIKKESDNKISVIPVSTLTTAQNLPTSNGSRASLDTLGITDATPQGKTLNHVLLQALPVKELWKIVFAYAKDFNPGLIRIFKGHANIPASLCAMMPQEFISAGKLSVVVPQPSVRAEYYVDLHSWHINNGQMSQARIKLPLRTTRLLKAHEFKKVITMNDDYFIAYGAHVVQVWNKNLVDKINEFTSFATADTIQEIVVLNEREIAMLFSWPARLSVWNVTSEREPITQILAKIFKQMQYPIMN